MAEDEQNPGGRLAANLERVYAGAAAALGWAVQPLAWLADFLQRDPEQTARWWRRNYMRPLFWLAVPLTPFWLVVIGLVGMNLIDQLVSDIPADPVERRTWYYGIGLTITGLGALLAAPFILIRTWVNERNTHAAEQGLITERFTRAVEQLGAEKTVKPKDGEEITAPNIEVRLGAIYALERIARDSERDHVPVMETLCAYIRENAREEPPRDFPLSPPDVDDDTVEEEVRDTRRATRELMPRNRRQFFGEAQPPRADIQAVFSVIARRTDRQKEIERESDPPFRLDLRRANLQSLDLTGVDLRGADLRSGRAGGGGPRRGAAGGGDPLEGAVLAGRGWRGRTSAGRLDLGARLEGADPRGGWRGQPSTGRGWRGRPSVGRGCNPPI